MFFVVYLMQMVQLSLQSNIPFDAAKYLGVIITGTAEQRHTGIIYREKVGDEPKVLHLGFHYLLLCNPIKPSYFWLHVGGLDETEQQAMAIWLEEVWLANHEKGIPYGINFGSGPYWNGSEFAGTEDAGGLTCATFVLSLFHFHEYQIIDVATSYTREDDVIWQEKILSAVASQASSDYVENQRKFIGIAARYRPEEVAGAVAAYDNSAIHFKSAVEYGDQILQQMGITIAAA